MLKVLFLCTGNSCRSQMAEGWARHLKGDQIEAYSAGIEAHGLNPDAVRVMAEAGVDISGQRSKRVGELQGAKFDYVVTVCGHAHENCPGISRQGDGHPCGFRRSASPGSRCQDGRGTIGPLSPGAGRNPGVCRDTANRPHSIPTARSFR